jgi:hypothetical protein
MFDAASVGNSQATHPFSTESNSTWAARGVAQWAPGAVIAIACGIVYFALRPPIFDGDGYTDLLAALDPKWVVNIDPAHLLTIPIQLLLLTISSAKPYPSTTIFQAAGILLNCTTLLFFYVLLFKSSRSRLFAVAATVFIAFSPRFWFVGFQNKPYPLSCLALVLYLYAWFTPDGKPPAALRLAAAAVSMTLLLLMQQAAVFMVAAGALAFLICDDQPPIRRLASAVVWGASVGAITMAVYLYFWQLVTGGYIDFLTWTTGNLAFNGPLQFQFPATLIQSVMGVSGTVLQDDAVREYLQENFAPQVTLALYGGLGTFFVLGIVAMVRWTKSNRWLLALIKNNSLFAVSLLSILFWAVIVMGYEPVYPNHWLLVLFPALVAMGVVFRESAGRFINVFVAIVVVLSCANIYLNRINDVADSRNAPELLAASIKQHLGKNDIFVVLANEDWYGDVEYELLFRYLKLSSDNRGYAILNDFILPAKGLQSWAGSLKNKIDSTLDAGGLVYVAGHVLDDDTYRDLSNTKGAFAPKEDPLAKRYQAIEGPSLFQAVSKVIDPYDPKESSFKLGDEEFFVIKHKADSAE